MKKNILIVAATSYAGMGPYVSEIVNTFEATDGVFFLFRDYDDDFFYKNVKKELHPCCSFIKQANSNWNKFKALFKEDKRFSNEVFALCAKNNIEVVHYICDPAPMQIAKRLEAQGIDVYGTVHDLHPHEAKKAFHKMIRHKISEKQRWDNTNYGKLLITNSVSQFDELKKLFPGKNIFFHAFPSLVTNEIKSGKEIPQELTNLDKPYILFFGRIEEYKGLALLYEAFVSDSKLRDNYYLVIAGSGELKIDGASNQKSIILLNRYIEDCEIKYLYERACCVVYPYLSATQSGVLSLSFYFGKPTLTSDIPFFRDIILPNKAGVLFKNGSSDDLKEKLKEVLTADNTEMRKNAKKTYDALYETSSIRAKLIEIYNFKK